MNKRTRRIAAAAHDKAKALGPIVPMQPAGFRVDQSPVLGENQVYVTKTGTVYHEGWCRAIADRWDQKPTALYVADISTVGLRTPCKSCLSPYGDARSKIRTES